MAPERRRVGVRSLPRAPDGPASGKGGTLVNRTIKAALSAITICVAAGVSAPQVDAAASDHVWRNIRMRNEPGVDTAVVGASCNDHDEGDIAKSKWNTLLTCNTYVPVPGKPGRFFSKRHWTFVYEDLESPDTCLSDGFYLPDGDPGMKVYKPSECRVVN